MLVDHRHTIGLNEAEAKGMPPGAGRGLFEAPTYTCSHCQTVVIINPARTRDRAYCRKCDHYICDNCSGVLARTHECKTFNQIIDEIQEAAVKGNNHGQTIIIG